MRSPMNTTYAMATSTSTSTEPEDCLCDICYETLSEPRVLDCSHVFCLDCLEKLECKKMIMCPQCRDVTEIPAGLQVRHLQTRVVKSTTRIEKLSLVTSWQVQNRIVAVAMDDATNILYVGTGNPDRPILMYNYAGSYRGHLKADRDLSYARLCVDSKRGLILAVRTIATDPCIVSFDREGTQVGVLRCPEFQLLEAISYHKELDKYIVIDRVAHCVYYVDPTSGTVTTTLAAPGTGELEQTVKVSCPRSQGSCWATSDWAANRVRLWNPDGSHLGEWSCKGSAFGQLERPSGICVDSRGRILVADQGNQRLVRMTAHEDCGQGLWEVYTNTRQFKLGSPRHLDVTDDGLVVMSMYDNCKRGPYHLALFSGYS